MAGGGPEAVFLVPILLQSIALARDEWMHNPICNSTDIQSCIFGLKQLPTEVRVLQSVALSFMVVVIIGGFCVFALSERAGKVITMLYPLAGVLIIVSCVILHSKYFGILNISLSYNISLAAGIIAFIIGVCMSWFCWSMKNDE